VYFGANRKDVSKKSKIFKQPDNNKKKKGILLVVVVCPVAGLMMRISSKAQKKSAEI